MSWIKNLVTLFVVSLILSNVTVLAQSPFFTATSDGPSAATGGIGVSDNFYATHRFLFSEPVKLTGIGGQFQNPFFNQTFTIFGAIVSLTGPTDIPDSLNLTTADVLTQTLLTVPPGDVDREAALSVDLNAGWYAIAFGTGLFGAPNNDAPISLVSRTVDLAPDQLPFTAIQSFSGGPGFFQVQDMANTSNVRVRRHGA